MQEIVLRFVQFFFNSFFSLPCDNVGSCVRARGMIERTQTPEPAQRPQWHTRAKSEKRHARTKRV